ncbi:hypothetical protein AMTRI_Chr10g5350 [Amborella trichopoda]|nr:WAT1-related protein At2g37460-like [Amborella trichopoda]|eukprot:XP_011627968.2 WAT1-related protein At2g37460-like [Amborella trichopoda]
MVKHAPLFAQILFQSSLAVMYVITRVAFERGMSRFIFVTYRQAIATLAISPFAYFLDKNKRPPMTLKDLGKIFILGLLGVPLSQILYFSGLYYTSSTFAATIMNLIPALAFVMAFLLRMEKVNLRSLRGQAKVVGTIICVSGAMIMTLIKGPVLGFLGFLKNPTALSDLLVTNSAVVMKDNWTLGPILLVLSVTAYSTWIVYQAWTFKDYPAQLSLTAMMLGMGTIQSAVISVIFDRSSAWKLGWNFELFTYAYSGIMCSALAFFIQSWCIKKRGPVFAAAFNPLCTVLVAILEPIILHVDVHVGSVVGMFLIICGLYFVLWGKAKDRKPAKILPTQNEETREEKKESGEGGIVLGMISENQNEGVVLEMISGNQNKDEIKN